MANTNLPLLYVVRHGETAWSLSGQHTGLSDIPLTEQGERNAVRLNQRLAGFTFAKVFSSPLQRARKTCELAGFGSQAAIDPDLVEWHYGDYEGLTTPQIYQQQSDWELFRDGCPGGESVVEIGERARRVVDRVRGIEGNVLLFSSSHFLRVLAASWLGLGPDRGQLFVLDTASISILGYEHSLRSPVIRRWNDCGREAVT